MSSERGAQIAEMREWWLTLATAEINRIVPKVREYGADDLIEIGRELATCMGWLADDDERGTSDAELAELGCFFYLVGKMARWRSAVRRGELVGDDTLHDIGVYVRMVQRIRKTGGWPGTVESDKAEPYREQFTSDSPEQADLDDLTPLFVAVQSRIRNLRVSGKLGRFEPSSQRQST